MARMARLVVPHHPHHVTQRGNRREWVFFGNHDYARYLEYLHEAAASAGTQVWAYCLMPNHVHLVMVPADAKGLSVTLAETHRRYTTTINWRYGWTGHLWQGRFHSCAMDEPHLLAAVRYVELNPVRAGLCAQAADWRWSSARAHLGLDENALLCKAPLRDLVPDWNEFLAEEGDTAGHARLEEHLRTGRPLGSDDFLSRVERMTGCPVRPRKAGRKPKNR